jgi:hypothetical protein
MKEELIQLTDHQWDSIMAEFHVKTAHDYFMNVYMNSPENSIPKKQAKAIIARLKNIHINFEAILQFTDPKWNVEDQDNANKRMRGTAEIDAYMYTATESERKEVLTLITKRTLARSNKFKEKTLIK